jgi:hypothetical protein
MFTSLSDSSFTDPITTLIAKESITKQEDVNTVNSASNTPAGSLINRHFMIGGHKKLSRRARKFHFGTSEHVDRTNITGAIPKLLYIPDEIENLPQPGYRNIVFVGHGLRFDFLILRKHGIMFEEISTIVAKFDTIYMATGGAGRKLPASVVAANPSMSEPESSQCWK